MPWDDDKEEVLKSIKAATDAVAVMTTKVDGQEKITQEFKQEIGDARKQAESVLETMKKMDGYDPEKIKDLEKTVDSLKKKAENIENQGGTDEEGSEPVLSKEEQKVADDVYKKLSQEEKAVIVSDPEKKKAFLIAAKASTPQSVPESLFIDHQVNTPDANEFVELFKRANRSASHVNATGNRSANNFDGADDRTNVDVQKGNLPRCIGGKIPSRSPSQD